jgi:hypothetical protein
MFNKKLFFFHQFKVLNYKPASRISNAYAAWFQDKNFVFQISSTAVANIPKESKISPNVKAHAIHKGTGCLTVVNQTNNFDMVPVHSFPFVQVGFCYALWHLMM